MRTLNLTDKNTFYAPASDDCWVLLAKEIMVSYAQSYVMQFPITTFSQLEYDKVDEQKYAPQRRSVLCRIKNGPLRNAIDINAVYYALESKRLHNIKSWGVKWKNHSTIDVNNL